MNVVFQQFSLNSPMMHNNTNKLTNKRRGRPVNVVFYKVNLHSLSVESGSFELADITSVSGQTNYLCQVLSIMLSSTNNLSQ